MGADLRNGETHFQEKCKYDCLPVPLNKILLLLQLPFGTNTFTRQICLQDISN